MRTGIIHAAQSAAGILEEIAEREGFADIKDFLDSVAPGLLPETLSEADEISDEELADDMADEEDSSEEEETLVVMSPPAFCAASLGLSDLAESETFDLSDVPVIEVGDEDVIHTDALWALWYQEMDDVHAGFDELDETILIDEAAQLVEKLGCS
jgi:hypothetical protein